MPKSDYAALLACYQKGNFQQLIALAQPQLVAAPADAALHNLVGASFAALNQPQQAIVSYQNAIAVQPGFLDAHCNLGALYNGLARYTDAINCYEQALAIEPSHAMTHNNLGSAHFNLGNYDQAVVAYQAAIASRPNYADAMANLANSYAKTGQLSAALKFYEQALVLQPDTVRWHLRLAEVLRALGQLNAAVRAYENALTLDVEQYDAHYQLALLRKLLGDNQAAITGFQHLLTLQPKHAKAHYSLANALSARGQYDTALAHYQRAISLQPNYAAAKAKKAYVLAQCCHWQALADGEADGSFNRQTLGLDSAVSPFDLLALDDNVARQSARCERFVTAAYPAKATPAAPPLKAGDVIRVGYFSADFHNHATLFLMARVFELHNTDAFEVHVFSYGPKRDDAMRRRLTALPIQFHEVGHLSDAAVAQFSRSLGVDIAVDLKGHTQHARMGIFACRAAPVQSTYLGYPGGTGARYIDYLIADSIVIPKADRKYYAEKVVSLPHSYQATDNHREIARSTMARSDHGLPSTGFVFCCFNNNYKICAEVFAIWMRLLQRTDGSVLWLFDANAYAQKNLQAAARQQGVDPARIVFAPRLTQSEHLARLAHADLFLDTFTCNAHTTASDALWAGLPVLTKIGESFAARVAASLLTAIELPELITRTAADYEQQALALASNSAKLQALKAKLAAQRDTAALFDSEQFTRNLERAYSRMMTCYANGRPPRAISL